MSNFKTLTTIAIATLFAAPVFAQDTQESPMIEVTPASAETHFASADLDQDGALNADEFVTFAVMQAESGDEGFKDVVLSGEYDTKFAAHDKDASGGITVEELGHQDTMEDAPVDMEFDEEPEDAPELN